MTIKLKCTREFYQKKGEVFKIGSHVSIPLANGKVISRVVAKVKDDIGLWFEIEINEEQRQPGILMPAIIEGFK